MVDTIDRRPIEQIREHYEIEKKLAAQLMSASSDSRRGLYSALYDELFRRVPHHPQLTRKASPEQQRHATQRQKRMLGRYVRPDTVFLEIGSGDCALVFDICRSVRFGYGLDVSETITDSADRPDNFQLVISDGTSIDVAAETVDLAYSNQLMEHLHPDDALTQLRNIYRALKPGGIYLCVTPNRLNGPHDISRRFDCVASGLHLREYTVTELDALFREAGFRKVRFLVGFSGRFVEAGIGVTKALEAMIGRLPVQRQIPVARTRGIRHLLFPRMVAFK